MKIKIRKATKKDLPILLDFEQGVIVAERPFDSTLKPDPITYYDLNKLIDSNDSELIVALIEDEIIGSGYAKILDSKPYLKHQQYAYLGFMFIKNEFRGQGVNQKIIDELCNWAKSKNITEVRLDVYDDNLSAMKAYEKVGFKKHLVEMRMKIN